MIRSMTGFGRAEAVYPSRRISVEMKSVNNRYLDFNIRMPKKFYFLEASVRQTLKKYVNRGKVDVFITAEESGDSAGLLRCNEALAGEYIGYMNELSRKYGLDSVTLSDVVRAPEVFTLGESDSDDDELWKELEPVLLDAAKAFDSARAAEGKALAGDLLAKLDGMDRLVDRITEHEPEILEAYRKKLTDKLAEILADAAIEEARIASECVIYADRICTDEETVRLKTHVRAMRKELTDGGVIGRKLDFLAQEMNREANTTLSKAGDIEIADIGIELKTEIEKIREQIQNIE